MVTPVPPSPGTASRWPRPQDLFYGWRIVGITVVALTVIGGATFQSLGVFFVALERQFGWSRTLLSGAFTLSRAEGALIGPVEGILTDRLGSRRMVLVGMGVLGVGFLLLSYVQSPIAFYAAFLVMFTGAGLGGWLPLMAAINHWFVRHRSKAMAIGMTGFNLGGLLVPALAWAITAFGWRATSQGLALLVWAMAIPVAWVVRGLPEKYGLHPDGDRPAATSPGDSPTLAASEGDHDFTLVEALQTRAFWFITASHSLSVAAFATIAVHIIPALTDKDIPLTMGGVIVATYTFTGVLFQLVGGFLGDRFPKPRAIAVFTGIQAISMVVAATMRTLPSVFLFAVLYGIGLGGRTPLLTAIRGDYFGRKNFATILGVSSFVINLATMAAPFLAGYLFDRLGSYTVAFFGLALLNLLGAVAILPARKPLAPTSRQPRPSSQTDA